MSAEMQAEQAGEHHAGEHRQQLAGVGGQQVEQILADVVVDAAAFLDRLDDAGEVVVGQHHVGGLLGDVGAGDAHGDADVGGLERGRVVDAVAGHGDDMALALQRADDAQLVFGIDAGEHAHVLDDGIELGVVHGAQLGAGDDPRAGLEDVQFARDRLGRRGVVAGDHDGADVRAAAQRATASFTSGARRVDHADQAEQHQVVLDAVRQLDVRHGSRASDRCRATRPARCASRSPSVRSAWLASASLRCRQLGASLRRSSGTGLPSSPSRSGSSRAGLRARP